MCNIEITLVTRAGTMVKKQLHNDSKEQGENIFTN